MKQTGESPENRIRRAWQYGAEDKTPSFDRVWQAAEERYTSSRKRYRNVASAAAVIAATVIALNWQSPTEQNNYIEIAELLGSTSWSAPSDVLLPDRKFDIYQDMPVLFESTEPAGGALL